MGKMMRGSSKASPLSGQLRLVQDPQAVCCIVRVVGLGGKKRRQRLDMIRIYVLGIGDRHEPQRRADQLWVGTAVRRRRFL